MFGSSRECKRPRATGNASELDAVHGTDVMREGEGNVTPDDDAIPPSPWTLVKEEPKFDCQYFSVHADLVSHSGQNARPYNHFRTKYDGVCVVPIDSEGNTILIGQHRFVLGKFTWEVPAGGSSRGASRIETAKAELSEEAGLRADHWLEIIEASSSPGMTDRMVTGFVAWGLHHGKPHPEPEETLISRRLPFRLAVEMALEGKIASLSSVALIVAIELRRTRNELPSGLMELLAR